MKACRSETAKREHIDNTPSSGVILDNLKLTANISTYKDHFKKPIYVSICIGVKG